jgi:excisionase family DNA binding protein
MTAGDLAEYLQVSRATVYRLMKREKDNGFPAVKLRGRWLVDLEQLQNWFVQVVEGREKPIARRTRRRSAEAKNVRNKIVTPLSVGASCERSKTER